MEGNLAEWTPVPCFGQGSAWVAPTEGSGLEHPGCNCEGFGLSVTLLVTVGIRSHEITQELLRDKKTLWALSDCSVDVRDLYLFLSSKKIKDFFLFFKAKGS